MSIRKDKTMNEKRQKYFFSDSDINQFLQK